MEAQKWIEAVDGRQGPDINDSSEDKGQPRKFKENLGSNGASYTSVEASMGSQCLRTRRLILGLNCLGGRLDSWRPPQSGAGVESYVEFSFNRLRKPFND